MPPHLQTWRRTTGARSKHVVLNHLLALVTNPCKPHPRGQEWGKKEEREEEREEERRPRRNQTRG
jgi:hypothetical protein